MLSEISDNSVFNFFAHEKAEILWEVIEGIAEKMHIAKHREFTTMEMRDFIYCEVQLFDAYSENDGGDAFYYQRNIPSKFMMYHNDIEHKLRRKAPEQYRAVMTALKYPELSVTELAEKLGKSKSTVSRQLRNAGQKISWLGRFLKR